MSNEPLDLDTKLVDLLSDIFTPEQGGALLYGAMLAWYWPEATAKVLNVGSKVSMEETGKDTTMVSNIVALLEKGYRPRERTSEEVEAYTHVAFNKD